MLYLIIKSRWLNEFLTRNKEHTMDQLGVDFFPVQEAMPCPPEAIKIGRYFLGNTILKNHRLEEAAARVISFSHQAGQWVGISYEKIAEMVHEDYRDHLRIEANEETYRRQLNAWNNALHRHSWLCLLTFGIYDWWNQKPDRPHNQSDHKEMPLSGIYEHGPEYIILGLGQLVQAGLLKIEDEQQGDSIIKVIFPTAKLISKIMEVRGITPTIKD